MDHLTIPQAAARLGVSVDTVRRRIKAGLLRASRNDQGAYVVEVPAAPSAAAAPAAPGPEEPQPSATDQHLFKKEARRSSDFPHEVRSLKELLDVERQRNEELREHLVFQRQQLEKAQAEREHLVALLETQQQQFGIEQLQRILGEAPARGSDER